MKSKFLAIVAATLITLTVLIGLTQAQAGNPQSSATFQIGMGTAFTYQGQHKKATPSSTLFTIFSSAVGMLRPMNRGDRKGINHG